MKYDLSDIEGVDVTHCEWFNDTVLPLIDAEYQRLIKRVREPEYPAGLQVALIRLWVEGPSEEDMNVRLKVAVKRGFDKVKDSAKTRTLRRERSLSDLWWEDYSDGAASPDSTAYDTLRVDEMMVDVPPRYRNFMRLWALDRRSLSDVAVQLGVSRATAFRWRDDCVSLLQEKWG